MNQSSGLHRADFPVRAAVAQLRQVKQKSSLRQACTLHCRDDDHRGLSLCSEHPYGRDYRPYPQETCSYSSDFNVNPQQDNSKEITMCIISMSNITFKAVHPLKITLEKQKSDNSQKCHCPNCSKKRPAVWLHFI